MLTVLDMRRTLGLLVEKPVDVIELVTGVRFAQYVIPPTSAYGVPANETYLPKILRDAANFTTAHTGKHHMGAGKWSWTPTWRGYESFLGFYGGGCDYYECENRHARATDRDLVSFDSTLDNNTSHATTRELHLLRRPVRRRL